MSIGNISVPTGAGNVCYICLCSLETSLVSLGLIIFILGVCFSDAGIDFMASIYCSEVPKAVFKGKALSINGLKAHSI